MNTVDDLIDLAARRAEAQEGNLNWLTANGRNLRGVFVIQPATRQPNWTPDEKSFLQENIYMIPEEEIAHRLGRSPVAIHVKKTRMSLKGKSKQPGYLTGNLVARALGSDIHSVMIMARRQIMPLIRLPGVKGILQISRLRLTMWAVNPKHWMYFKVARMQDKHLQRLVQLAQSRWNDEWMTTGQVGEYLGVDHGLIENRIRKGMIPAVKWGNWWVKRSDIEYVVIFTGSGRAGFSHIFTPAGDAFIERSVEAGYSYVAIGRMMKVSTESVRHRWLLYLSPPQSPHPGKHRMEGSEKQEEEKE